MHTMFSPSTHLLGAGVELVSTSSYDPLLFFLLTNLPVCVCGCVYVCSATPSDSTSTQQHILCIKEALMYSL